MAEATADPDFTPIITIDILVQAGRYPIDLKQGHLENAFVCPCIFLLFFFIITIISISVTIVIIIIIITTIVTIIVLIRKSSSSSSSSSSSGHPHYRHRQGHHHHFITGKSKASDSPCFSAEFVHCQNSRTELTAAPSTAQKKRCSSAAAKLITNS